MVNEIPGGKLLGTPIEDTKPYTPEYREPKRIPKVRTTIYATEIPEESPEFREVLDRFIEKYTGVFGYWNDRQLLFMFYLFVKENEGKG